MTGPSDKEWPSIVEAALFLSGEMGINRTLWARACQVMGREYAAVALAIVSTKQQGKEPGQINSSPGGYFAGMLRKFEKNSQDLSLSRTRCGICRITPELQHSWRETRARIDMRKTGTDTPLTATRRMLDIFASGGAECFHVTWTNSAGSPRRPRSLRAALQSLGGPLPQTENADWLDAVYIAGISIADLNRTIPALLETATADRLNLTVRPRGRGMRFIQLDDLAADKLPALAAAMFLILETSPGNYQAWLALPGEHDREFARRVRRGAGADLTASGATKIAGSLNYKDKYAPDFPRVTIRQAQPGRMTNPAELEQLGLVAPLSPARLFSRGTDKWPSDALCLDKALHKRDGSGPDRSRADYVWVHGTVNLADFETEFGNNLA